jgi:hypothetical protein
MHDHLNLYWPHLELTMLNFRHSYLPWGELAISLWLFFLMHYYWYMSSVELEPLNYCFLLWWMPLSPSIIHYRLEHIYQTDYWRNFKHTLNINRQLLLLFTILFQTLQIISYILKCTHCLGYSSLLFLSRLMFTYRSHRITLIYVFLKVSWICFILKKNVNFLHK